MSHRLRLATVLPLAGDRVARLRDAVAMERAGVDVLGVAEAYGQDAVSALGYLAATTERVELMTSILPIYTRTPTLTAMTAVGLDTVSGGRFILGLGASGPQVIEGFHGVPYDAPVGRTREVIEICRQVWRRERVEFSGRHYQLPLPTEQGTGMGKPLKLIDRPLRAEIPVYLAALGEKNVELAAELANGWLPFLFVPERAASVWAAALAAGARSRAPELGPLQIVAGGPLAIGPDVTSLRELARPHLALYIGGMGARGKNFYNAVVQRYGFEREARQIQDLYLDGKKDQAAAQVPAELLADTSLIGDEAYLRDRLAAYVESGVTTLQVTPAGPDPLGDITRLRELIESV
jgi:F420-dependent oxidoreductase-like protein